MIPRDYITEWRAQARWAQDFQVEQADGFSWDIEAAAMTVRSRLIERLPGEPWKGEKMSEF